MSHFTGEKTEAWRDEMTLPKVLPVVKQSSELNSSLLTPKLEDFPPLQHGRASISSSSKQKSWNRCFPKSVSSDSCKYMTYKEGTIEIQLLFSFSL